MTKDSYQGKKEHECMASNIRLILKILISNQYVIQQKLKIDMGYILLHG
jgi:hypothetical protein